MYAIRFHRYGGAEVLTYEEVPRPEPENDQILIRVHAAAVNPADWQIRSGKRFLVEEPFSHALGFDVSGVVEAAGGSVKRFSAGDEVYAFLGLQNAGGYAEYVTCPASAAAFKPGSLDHIEAAALPVVSLTAWQALFDTAKLSKGQKILIQAAAGGVGHIAVQLARWKGAHVIGTASARNKEFLRRIGCDEVIDYETTRFEDVVQDVDVILDSIIRDANKATDVLAREALERSFGVLKKDGFLVSLCAAPPTKTAAAYGVGAAHVLAEPNASQLAEVAGLADAGYLTPFINTVIPLEDACKAHELSQRGHTRGKIVLQVV